MKALIVDEVFDGDRLDLAIVHLAAATDIPTTLIGDPWQAFYEFRGARPELVAKIVESLAFDTLPVTQSFRLETSEMQQLARALRAGEGVTVPTGADGDVDVVLASWWKPLWGVADNVLPLVFGQINNRTDAAMAVLLERYVSSHFGHVRTRGPEAAMVLGLDPEIFRGDAGVFAPVLDRLEGGTTTDARAALALLRTTLTDMGSRPFGKMKDTEEADRIELLGALGRRLSWALGTWTSKTCATASGAHPRQRCASRSGLHRSIGAYRGQDSRRSRDPAELGPTVRSATSGQAGRVLRAPR
jgi:DNA helicase II / ATP-dependent DNA helicase PcrA